MKAPYSCCDLVSFKKYQEQINKKIKQQTDLFPQTGKLKEACQYALLNGGKRLRPSIVLMVADALGHSVDVSLAALAIEYFHTASLVADDLPCMDDDDERRNKPAVHKIFGETIALLVSYALISEGYGAIAATKNGYVETFPENKALAAEIVGLALENAALNTGLYGATGGQYLDIFPYDLSEAGLKDVIHKKTTSLFEIAFVLGWVFGGGQIKDLDLVKRCASHFGLAFQIADDLGDVEQDLKNGRKVNVAALLGETRALEMLKKESEEYRSLLKLLKIDSIDLVDLL